MSCQLVVSEATRGGTRMYEFPALPGVLAPQELVLVPVKGLPLAVEYSDLRILKVLEAFET
eukprot:8235812-Alexandrium_andersonii.AAC.1